MKGDNNRGYKNMEYLIDKFEKDMMKQTELLVESINDNTVKLTHLYSCIDSEKSRIEDVKALIKLLRDEKINLADDIKKKQEVLADLYKSRSKEDTPKPADIQTVDKINNRVVQTYSKRKLNSCPNCSNELVVESISLNIEKERLNMYSNKQVDTKAYLCLNCNRYYISESIILKYM